MPDTNEDTARPPKWVRVAALSDLDKTPRKVVKIAGKQILLIKAKSIIYACNNRCPHEGFPLIEGTLSDAPGTNGQGDKCILTCNWHSWRFDLEDGKALVGGDAVRIYNHQIRDGDIWLDLVDPPPAQVRQKAIDGLRQAFDTHDYERIARELARFERAGGDPLDVLALAFEWAMDGLEFGTTHAHAAAPDWLSLRGSLDDQIERRIPVVEIIGHLAWDVMMQKGPFPLTKKIARQYNDEALAAAIESEDEPTAIALARAGLHDGGAKVLHQTLQQVALRHYQAFGHSVIYFDKVFELATALGGRADVALILPLVRSYCSTSREDLIPEFRAYAPALAAWDGMGEKVPDADAFRDMGVAAAMELIGHSSANQQALFNALIYAASDAMLHYDARYRAYNDKPVQQNIDWLDFTHAITHLNAARKICSQQPALWANAFLQTGCFLGRNAKFVDWQQNMDVWQVDDAEAFLDDVLASMLDHGEPLYIFPAHTLKLTTALKEELKLNPDAPWKGVAMAALNRFVNEPIKRKHMKRVVTQASKFVELEG